MPRRKTTYTRETKETAICIELDLDTQNELHVNTGVPFFDHLLSAMAFHGNFSITVKAEGDLEVDAHHTVEDTGLVLGEALNKMVREYGVVKRFGHAVIPMDDALSEVVLDISGRAYFVFQGDFPQANCGNFELVLIREFLNALAVRARINLHVYLRYGANSHHMAEALFKALGKAIEQAYSQADGEMSSKGTISD